MLQECFGPCALHAPDRREEDTGLVVALKEARLLVLWEHGVQALLLGAGAPSMMVHELSSTANG